LQASDEDIAKLLNDQDVTLEQWFDRFMVTEEPDLVLAGGERPPPHRIREIFDRWFERSQDRLRHLLCGRLGYGELSQAERSTREITVVAVVASAIAVSPMPEAVDPMLTAALLVSRQKLDTLCDGYQPPGAHTSS
jgi:hypothetical protein